MAKSKNSAKIALEKSFLPSGLTLEGPVGPPNPFETFQMVILHGLGYGPLGKTQIGGFHQLSV